MTALRIVIFTGSLLLVQQTQAQIMLQPMSKKQGLSTAAAQISSPTNYSMLEPIGSKATVIVALGDGVEQEPATSEPRPSAKAAPTSSTQNRFQWKSGLLMPLVVEDAEKRAAAANRIASAKHVAAAVMAPKQTFEEPPTPPAPLLQEETSQQVDATQSFVQQRPAPQSHNGPDFIETVRQEQRPHPEQRPAQQYQLEQRRAPRYQPEQRRIYAEQPAARQRTEESYSIEVAPISFKSGAFDLYEFAIRNPGSKTLSQATIKLAAPAGCLVQQVIPKPDSVNGGEVQFSIGELAPGGEQVVEIMIENPRNELARFDTVIISENWNGEATSTAPTTVANASQHELQFEAEDSPAFPTLEPADATTFEPRIPAITVAATTAAGQTAIGSTPAGSTTRRNHHHYSFPQETPATTSLENESLTFEDGGDTSQQFYEVGTTIDGPTALGIGEEAEFAITLENQSVTATGSLIVQLSIPRGFKITVLDRPAWYDAEGRKISWEIPAIEAQRYETIRYKGMVKFPGSCKQGIVVGMNDTLQGFCSLTTTAQ